MAKQAGERTILLIEGTAADDDSLADSLLRSGLKVVSFYTGREALSWAQGNRPSLIILDASSMRSSGARICRRMRAALEDVPIIHCRAHGMAEDPGALADVYLERPFTGRKLLNRVRTLLPVDLTSEELIRYGRLLLYRTKRAVQVEGRGEWRLTPKQASLLEELLRHPNELISRRQIMRNVWDTDYVGDTRTLDVHIRWIRECIEEDPSHPQLLRTVRGKGFILSIPEGEPR